MLLTNVALFFLSSRGRFKMRTGCCAVCLGQCFWKIVSVGCESPAVCLMTDTTKTTRTKQWNQQGHHAPSKMEGVSFDLSLKGFENKTRQIFPLMEDKRGGGTMTFFSQSSTFPSHAHEWWETEKNKIKEYKTLSGSPERRCCASGREPRLLLLLLFGCTISIFKRNSPCVKFRDGFVVVFSHVNSKEKKKDRDWADFRDGVNHDKITGHTEHTQVDDGLMRDER